MDITSLRIGIIHSLVGKNDGVSIVIDQTVQAMVKFLQIPLGNIHFLAAHAPSRFNLTLDETFWHKSEASKYILSHFNGKAPARLETHIRHNAQQARDSIARFVKDNRIDLLIAHNTSHVYNFIGAVGLGMYLEERRKEGVLAPRCLLWWHDSYFERTGFADPNRVIRKYLKYIPGFHNDAIVFINNGQLEHARSYFSKWSRSRQDVFFKRKTIVIPNTFDISWNWRKQGRRTKMLHPPVDPYNKTLFKDLGLIAALRDRGYALKDAVFLLQHTRIVPRKRIEIAIDFAFRMAAIFKRRRRKRCIVLLVAGHSGDEQAPYREQLEEYFRAQKEEHDDLDVLFLLGEHIIFPSREVIVDRKFYRFRDIPAVIAAHGGMGTFFSEVEGFGNNLLEMLGAGLPVAIHKYDVFKSDLEPYGFKLPAIDNWNLTDCFMEQCYRLLTRPDLRNRHVCHNLNVLEKKLNSRVIADKLGTVISNMFSYR